MRSKLITIFLITFIISLGGVACAQWALRSVGFTQGFKNVAQNKVSEFLKAKVEIGKVNVGFLNKIALNKLQIDGDQEDNPFRFQVDQIVFRYNFLKILARNLETPASILLKAPRLVLKDTQFPYAIFKDLDIGTSRESISMLELRGGEIRYPLPRFDSEIILKDIHGTFKPKVIGRVHADLKAQASGFINGQVRIVGEIDPLKSSHELQINLEDAHFSTGVNIPLEAMKGTVRWIDGDLFFDDVHAQVHGWETTIHGGLKNLEVGKEPTLILDFVVGKHKKFFQMSLKTDLETSEMNGAFQILSEPSQSFVGTIDKVDQTFKFNDVKLDNGYVGDGKFNFDSGAYAFVFKREQQKIALESNVNHLDFQFDLLLNHLDAFGLDLVTSASIELKERKTLKTDSTIAFDGAFNTDYFILEQTPFDDLRGTFRLTRKGLEGLQGTWGKVFSVDGGVFASTGGPEARLTLKADGYDLSELHEFAAQPLPKKIGGLLEGKLKLNGPLKKPEVQGDFTVKKGSAGRLEYDRAFIHFHGFLPYLVLNDSRILKGRTTLHLKGALDFSLEKFYHGVSLQSSDKIVLWKGWEVTSSQADGDFEIEHLMARFPTLSLKAGLDSRGAVGDPEGNQEDHYVALGSKFKF